MMVAGFESATSGHVMLDGTDITTVPAHKRGLGVVFQGYALFPHMTVAENVAYPLRMRRVKKSEQQRLVGDALSQVHLGDYGDRFPRQLSGGQQQRVALARALVFNPPLLLMDEPLGALDRKLRQSMQREIRSLHRESGATILFVTHDQDEALDLSDRIAVMRNGKIVQFGSPEEIYDRPNCLFVASFIGETNIMPARAEGAGLAGGLMSVRMEDGSIAQTTAAEQVPAGAQVSIVIRPEKLTIRQVQSTEPPDGGGTSVTVVDCTFLGSDVRYLTHTADGHELVIRQPAGRMPIGIGETLHVNWEGSDALAFHE